MNIVRKHENITNSMNEYVYLQADAVRQKFEEAKMLKKHEAIRKAEKEEQERAEKEVMERVNKRGVDITGATIDWDVVQI